MKTTIKVVNVYDTLLEETKRKILVINEQKERFMGNLLDDEKSWICEEVKETLYSVEFDGSIEETIDKIVEVEIENEFKVYDCTKRTLAWWGYLNGLFEEHVKVA